MRKRNKAITFRMSDEEYSVLEKKVEESGQTLQSYLISSSLGAVITSKEEVDFIKEKNKIYEDMDKQLRGMGTNLNQLAHVANGYGEIPSIDILFDILSEVRKIRKEVNEEWQSTRQSISRLKHTVQ